MLCHKTLASDTIQWVFHQPYSSPLAMHSMRPPLLTASTFPSCFWKANRWQSHEAWEMQSSLYVYNLQQCQHRPLPTVQLLWQKAVFPLWPKQNIAIANWLLTGLCEMYTSWKQGVFLSFPGDGQMCLLKLIGFVENVLDCETWNWWGLNSVENTWQLDRGWEHVFLRLPAIGWKLYPW